MQDVAAADRVAGDHRDAPASAAAGSARAGRRRRGGRRPARRPRRRRCSRRRRGSAGRRPSRRPRSPAPVRMIAADLDVVAGAGEGVAQLGQRRRPEGVADLGAVDRDPGDRLGRARRGCPRSRPALATRSARRARSRRGRPCGVGIGHESARRYPGRRCISTTGSPARRDLSRPHALVAGGDELELRRARARRRRRPRAGWPRAGSGAGSRWRSSSSPGSSRSSSLHALMKLGAVAYPLDPRARRAASARGDSSGRARPWRSTSAGDLGSDARPTCRCSASTTSTRPARRVLTSGTRRARRAGRAHLRQPPLERGRLRLQPRRRADRPLALLPAALPRRRALDRDALGRSTGPTAVVHDGFDVDRVADVARGRRRSPWSRWSRPS